MNRLCQLAPTKTRRGLVGAATLVAVLAPGASAHALMPAPASVAQALTPYVVMATAYSFGGTTLTIPIPHATCVDFVGGRTILNKELSSVKVPAGIVVTLFENFGCAGGASARLESGDHPNLSNVPGPTGPVYFNDRASSFLAFPL